MYSCIYINLYTYANGLPFKRAVPLNEHMSNRGVGEVGGLGRESKKGIEVEGCSRKGGGEGREVGREGKGGREREGSKFYCWQLWHIQNNGKTFLRSVLL